MERIRITKVVRTGTSLSIVIPKSILQALNIQRGDQVVFGIMDDQTIAVRKIKAEELKLIRPPHEQII